ncbi:MAG: 3-dehydroquinate synthase, partial [Halobacteriovoraceae bacterium]|nr:3-dehydroquinate synthase [Halobacteriovoraceae bacterium]
MYKLETGNNHMLLESQEDVFNAIEHAKFIIADQNVLNLYPQIAFLCNQKSTYSISEPEAQKSLCDYEKIIKFFLDKNITRVDEILAIGGGATTDLAGFVAATILRGVEWSVVPTTLLAMIDASIGGKVGINTDEGKNLIGSFHLPIKTYLNQNFLATLPSHEFDSGMGELVKYTFLNLEIRDAILADGFNQKIVLSCYAHKMSIVENDLQEKGNRKSLNLGHSFGHAIE